MSRRGWTGAWRATLLAAPCLAASFLAASCTSSGVSQTGIVSGQLLRVGGPADAPGAPLRGQVSISSALGVVTREAVTSSGHFAVRVPVGTYSLSGSSPLIDDGNLRCVASPGTVTVRAGTSTRRDVVCHIS